MTTARKRPAPATGNRPSSNANGFHQSSALTRFYGLDRHEPMDAEDRADLAVVAAAAERGYRIAVRCRACGAWLTNPVSVRQFIGPKCRAKAVGA
jgi:hypothetical protein